MKKLILGVFLLFSFCMLGAEYIDGIYYVAADKATYGWKPFTEMVIKEGQISSITFDRVNKKGEFASFDEKYNKRMKKKSGINPEEYSVQIPKKYFEAGKNLEDMDAVSGATDSVREFKIMMTFLLDKAQKGETGKFEIKKSDLK